MCVHTYIHHIRTIINRQASLLLGKESVRKHLCKDIKNRDRVEANIMVGLLVHLIFAADQTKKRKEEKVRRYLGLPSKYQRHFGFAQIVTFEKDLHISYFF